MTTVSHEELASRLGTRLRERRSALDLTLSQVAAEADVSVSYLSALEGGRHMPSLPVLTKVVHALRLTIAEVLREDHQPIVRHGTIGPDGSGVQDMSHPALRMEVVRVGAPPGDRGSAPVDVQGGQLFVFVERGALVLEVDGTSHALGQGDALDAIDAHDVSWQTIGEVETSAVWAAAPLNRREPHA